MDQMVGLSSIWGSSEGAYSGLIAQTLALCKGFSRFFLQELAAHAGTDLPRSLTDRLRALSADKTVSIAAHTERYLDSYGRSDVHVEFGDELVIMIENKITAPLLRGQLIRYDTYLRGQSVPYILLLIAPMKYELPAHERPSADANFCRLTYSLLVKWINNYVDQNQLTEEIERIYLCSVRDFFAEVEMPTTVLLEEINALKTYALARAAERKLSSVIKKLGAAVELNVGNYMLGLKMAGSFPPIFFGFRYGTDWYFSAPLLNDMCEGIIYVKDIESDSTVAASINERLGRIKAQLDDILRDTGERVDFYERKGRNECRLAIRKSVDAFGNGDLELMGKWLESTLEILESKLTLHFS